MGHLTRLQSPAAVPRRFCGYAIVPTAAASSPAAAGSSPDSSKSSRQTLPPSLAAGTWGCRLALRKPAFYSCLCHKAPCSWFLATISLYPQSSPTQLSLLSAAQSDLSFCLWFVRESSVISHSRGALHPGFAHWGLKLQAVTLSHVHAADHMRARRVGEGGSAQHPEIAWSVLGSPSPGCPRGAVDRASRGSL